MVLFVCVLQVLSVIGVFVCGSLGDCVVGATLWLLVVGLSALRVFSLYSGGWGRVFLHGSLLDWLGGSDDS